MDEKKFTECLNYHKKLRSLPPTKLVKLHHSIFFGTEHWVEIPSWVHRGILERRLFIYFCSKNWYHDIEAPATAKFIERAQTVLSADYVTEAEDEFKKVKAELDEFEHFSKESIAEMPIVRVDRFLAGLGVNLDDSVTDDIKRECLWEFFHLPVHKISKISTVQKKTRRIRRKHGARNKYILRDIIKANPTMNFEQFLSMYGRVMPTISSNVFANARSLLRKAGFDIPRLRKNCFLDPD